MVTQSKNLVPERVTQKYVTEFYLKNSRFGKKSTKLTFLNQRNYIGGFMTFTGTSQHRERGYCTYSSQKKHKGYCHCKTDILVVLVTEDSTTHHKIGENRPS